uniref:Uncharacterized protein n=1 Tax=Trypanosoma vivax (strain Y486) TaxID=1055687 RepID=G0U452_TRYVY|nr:conserved hypothetical protein [Trypanosoma vivax Y486]
MRLVDQCPNSICTNTGKNCNTLEGVQSYRNKCIFHYGRVTSPFVSEERESVPSVEGPPLSFILTRGKSTARRHDSSQRYSSVSSAVVTERHFVPCSESAPDTATVFDETWAPNNTGKRSDDVVREDDLTVWKHRYFDVNKQLAIATQCIRIYHKLFSTLRDSHSEATCDNAEALVGGGAGSPFRTEDVLAVVSQGFRRDADVSGECATAATASAGAFNKVQRRSASSKRLNRGVEKVVLFDVTSPSDYFQEQKDEWLARERDLLARQERFAAALRRCRQEIAAATRLNEEKELELSNAVSKQLAAADELKEAQTRIRVLEDIGSQRIRENISLREQLQKLESLLDQSQYSARGSGQLCVEVRRPTQDGADHIGDTSRHDLKTQLLHLIASLERGESRRNWITSQLLQALDSVSDGAAANVARSASNHWEVKKIVESLQVLLDAALKPLYDARNIPLPMKEALTQLQDHSPCRGGTTELLRRAQKYVSYLALWAGSLQVQSFGHNRITPPACGVIEAGADCVVDRAAACVVKPFSIDAEEISCPDVEEKGEISEVSSADKQGVLHQELVDSTRRMATMQALFRINLARVQEHIGEQVDEFSRTLELMLVNAVEALKQVQREQVVREKNDLDELQRQLDVLIKEEKENIPPQDDPVALPRKCDFSAGDPVDKVRASGLSFDPLKSRERCNYWQLATNQHFPAPASELCDAASPEGKGTPAYCALYGSRSECMKENAYCCESEQPAVSSEQCSSSLIQYRKSKQAKRTVTFAPEVKRHGSTITSVPSRSSTY